jgi:hypothetical protein
VNSARASDLTPGSAAKAATPAPPPAKAECESIALRKHQPGGGAGIGDQDHAAFLTSSSDQGDRWLVLLMFGGLWVPLHGKLERWSSG